MSSMTALGAPVTHQLSEQNLHSSPLCRLPEELIVVIMRQLQLLLLDDDEGEKPLICWFTRWLPLTTTCRHLRSIALRSRGLWRSVDLGYSNPDNERRWLDICLERGHPNKLDMRVYWDPDFLTIMHPLVGVIPNVHTAQVFMPNDGTEDYQKWMLEDVLTRLWPRLEYMVVVIEPDDPVDHLPLWPSLLGGHSDTLVSLCLHGRWKLQTPLPLFPHLQQLTIRECDLGDTPGCLRAFLVHTPKLTALSVDVARRPESIIELGCADSRRVDLPLLLTLHLTGAHDSLSTLLGIVPDPQSHLFLQPYQKALLSPAPPPAQLARAAMCVLRFARRARPRLEYVVRFDRKASRKDGAMQEALIMHHVGLRGVRESDPTLRPAGQEARVLLYDASCQAIESFLAACAGVRARDAGACEESGVAGGEVITTMDFRQWGRWSTHASRLEGIEEYLTGRKARNDPMKTLVIDGKPKHGAIEERWIRAGLVCEIVWMRHGHQGVNSIVEGRYASL